jgi:hypothetical protein
VEQVGRFDERFFAYVELHQSQTCGLARGYRCTYEGSRVGLQQPPRSLAHASESLPAQGVARSRRPCIDAPGRIHTSDRKGRHPGADERHRSARSAPNAPPCVGARLRRLVPAATTLAMVSALLLHRPRLLPYG